jgi:hypothetical protein
VRPNDGVSGPMSVGLSMRMQEHQNGSSSRKAWLEKRKGNVNNEGLSVVPMDILRSIGDQLQDFSSLLYHLTVCEAQ